MTNDNTEISLPEGVEEILELEARRVAEQMIEGYKIQAKEAWEVKKVRLASTVSIQEARERIMNDPVLEACFVSGFVSGLMLGIKD